MLNAFSLQEYAIDKRIILDVRVEDVTGAFYNVEVQKQEHPAFLERMLFGWAETYRTQLLRGEKYDELRPVRSIIITEFPIFTSLTRLHAVFELRARENPAVLFSDHCQIHVLRLGDLLRDLVGLDQFCLDLRSWMQFWVYGSTLEERKMSAMLQETPAVLEAYEEFKRFSSDPIMREKVQARERYLIDERLKLGGARREGETIGEARKARETARNMKRKGYPISDIAELTGLTLSEIEQFG